MEQCSIYSSDNSIIDVEELETVPRDTGTSSHSVDMEVELVHEGPSHRSSNNEGGDSLLNTTIASDNSDDLDAGVGISYKSRKFGDYVYLKPPNADRISLCVQLLEDEPENTSDLLNDKAPIGFKGNGTFLIQMKCMDDLSTFRLDGVANWSSHGSRKAVGPTFCTYYKTDDCPNFKKNVYVLREGEPNYKLFQAVVDYRWVGGAEPTDFTMKPRANSGGKLRQGCTSLGHTILKKVVSENPKLGSKESLQLAQKVAQDNSCSIFSCPTVSRQAEGKKSAVKKTNESDTPATLLFRQGVSFTCANIRGASVDAKNCVVSVQSDYHLAMIRKFVLPGKQTGHSSYSNLHIDGVFETSAYHMITTSIKHPYIRRRNNRSPNAYKTGNSSCNAAAAVIAGPTLLMTGKSQVEYVQAFQLLTAAIQNSCQQSSPRGAKNDPWTWTPVVVTDNEQAMRQALRYLIPNSTFLLCMLHGRKNTRMHLEKTYPGDEHERHIAETLVDIYGSDLSGNSQYYAGLVDCDTIKDFDDQLGALVDMWEKKLPGFYKWFITYQKCDLCDCVIRSARKPAGMENVLPQNNPSESLNSVRKRTFPKADRKMATLQNIVITLQQLNENEIRDIAELLVGRGDFEPLPGAPLPEPSVDILSDDVKRGNAYKILFGFIPSPDPLQHLIGLDNSDVGSVKIDFPISFADSKLSTTFRGIWNSALTILRSQTVTPDADSSSQRLCYVIADKKNRSTQGVSWDTERRIAQCGCLEFKRIEICSHSLVASHIAGQLAVHLDQFNNREIGFLQAIKPTESGGGNKGPSTKRWGDRKRTAGATLREGKFERKRQKVELALTPSTSVNEPFSACLMTNSQPASNSVHSASGKLPIIPQKTVQMDPWLVASGPFRVERCSPDYTNCKCYGCDQKLCADGTPDMVLVRNEPHYVRGTTGDKRSLTPSRPTTYHMSLRCIRRRHGDFVLSNVSRFTNTILCNSELDDVDQDIFDAFVSSCRK